MKTARIITSVLVMSVVLACSVFPAFAIGAVKKSTSASFQGPNVNYFASVRATQYQGVGTAGNGTSTSAYVGESQIVVTVSFFNDGDDPWYLDGVYVRLNDSSTATHNLTDFDIIGGNLTVAQTGTPYSFSIFGGENNAYNDGFVVAPHSNLTVAFSVAAFATSDSGVGVFSLNTVSFGASTNSVGDYPYGLDVDFSPLIDYLNSNVVPELLDQGVTLDNILSSLNVSSVSGLPVLNATGNRTTYKNYTNNNVTTNGCMTVGRPYFVSGDYDLNNSQFSYDYIICIPTYFTVRYVNNNDFNVYGSDRYFSVSYNNGFTTNASYLGTEFELVQGEVAPFNLDTGISGACYFYSPYTHNDYISLNAGQTQLFCFVLNRYYGVQSLDSVTDLTFTINSSYFGLPNMVFTSWETQTDTDLDTIHDQEQQWYQQNEQAIESTGLANYQFTTSQISGLTAITTQFSQVWDALGDWTLVYIFTLLLSFATYILRHRPSTKSQQRVAASEEYRYSNFMNNLAWRNEIRARWKAQDARYDKGDSSGASDLMRRNVRR